MGDVINLHETDEDNYVTIICKKCLEVHRSFYTDWHLNTNHRYEKDPCPSCGNAPNIFIIGDVDMVVVPTTGDNAYCYMYGDDIDLEEGH